jgi:hypothetical protein
LIANEQDEPKIWKAQVGPQEEMIRTAGFVDELLYGGAAGGAKTNSLINCAAADIDQGKNWNAVIFRRSYPELDDIIAQTHEWYPQLGGDYKVGAHEWHFDTGAIIRLRHIESELDFPKYQGWSISALYWDELTNWQNDKVYLMMMSRLRGPAKRKRVRCTSNPSGVGHNWVKARFVDPAPPRTLVTGENGMTRMFIPAKVTDNKILLANDPDYITRLKQVGDPDLVKAWLDGDWDAVQGAYFSAWTNEVKVPSFELNDTMPLVAAMDYGESSETAFLLATTDFDNNIFIIAEYYQANRSASQHAEAINELIDSCPFTDGRRPSIVICDPSMFTKRRLNSTINNSPADIFAQNGLYLTRGANERIAGWRVINDALVKKRLFVFDGWCDNLCRTMPALPRDRKNNADVDTKSEDHAADALRYLMMYAARAQKPPSPESKDMRYGKNVINSIQTKRKRGSRYAA